MNAAPHLIELAAAIADGTPIDWEAVASGSDPVDGVLVDRLRAIERIALAHASLPPAATFARTLHAAVFDDPAATWGSFVIVRKIGRGTHADVYLARDPKLDRLVALKLLRHRSTAARDSEVIDEARLLARVRHPNVVTVYGAECIDGRVGISMEYVDGMTLEEELRARGPFAADALIQVGTALCDALSAVHAAGLVHRDVKAQNVIRGTDGRVLLTDFGTGRDMTETGKVVELAGTPLYMAPEILDGRAASQASDLYSAGVVLFHLATGSFPILAPSLDGVRRAHHEPRRRSLSADRPDLPRALVETIERAAEPDVHRRFTDATAFRQALRTAASLNAADSIPTRRTRAPWLAAFSVTAAVVVAATFGRSLASSRRPASGRSGSPEAGPVMRKVAAPKMGMFRAGTPSFDGRLYVNTDVNEDLQVFDLESGAAVRVTNKGHADEYAEFSALSPDGARIAYSWLRADGSYDLRTIDVNGTDLRILVPPGRALQIIPIEWSRDGSLVLCRLRQNGGRNEIGVVTPSTRELRVIRDLGNVLPQHIALSPDARFVAYDVPADGAPTQRDIDIQPVDGGEPFAAITQPADDLSPVWTPDGGRLFFLSNRAGTFDGWVVAIENGMPVGEPQLVARNLGQVAIAGFTSQGALYYWRQSGDMDIYTRSLDPAAGGRSERVPSRFVGSNSGPAWSPDGRSLAYISRRSPGGPTPQGVVVVHSLEGAPDREIPIPLQTVSPGRLRWSPDGRELLVGGVNGTGLSGKFILNVVTGAIAPAVTAPQDRASTDIGAARWWIDDTSIAYVSARGIVVRERHSTAERVVMNLADDTPPVQVVNFDISPDRRSLALAGVIQGSDPLVQVLLVTTLGGEPSEVMRTTMPDRITLQGWTPDGRGLLVTRRDVRAPGPDALWRIGVDGTARATGIRIPGFTQVNGIDIDPTGGRIAYTVDQVSWELWDLEHFLPRATR